MSEGRWRRLSNAATLAAGTHALAGLSMALVLRLGLDTQADIEARLRFVDGQRALWVAGWVPWNLAALSMVWLCLCFWRAHEAGRLAVWLVTAAAALDLSAEALEMLALPDLAAAARASEPDAFLAMHRRVVLMTGFGANGLYTAAVLVLASRTRSRYGPAVNLAAAAVVVSGGALSCAALAHSTAGMVWSNVVLVPALLLWLFGVGRDAARRSAIPARLPD